MLILFDIDGTLLLAGGAGARSMAAAGRELFGSTFTLDGIDLAGRLDPLIWADAAAAAGVPDPTDHHERFRGVYADTLHREMETNRPARAPGALDLVARFRAVDGVTIGLLTGNYPETGRLKVGAAGFDPDWFPVAAWGSDGDHRRALPPVAMDRYAEHTGHGIEAEQVVIIGDTPHDIDCAAANGCVSIGVATGPSYSMRDLAAHAPDLLVETLEDGPAIVDWVLARRARRRGGVS